MAIWGFAASWRRFVSKCAATTAIAAVLCLGGSSASAGTPPPAKELATGEFFDWFVNSSPGNVPAPFLKDSNASSVNAFLKSLPPNSIRAIKIEVPISNATANLIFNNPSYNVSYVLGDLEMANAEQKVKTLAQQVRFVNGQNNGTKTRSFNAFIGNYGFQKLSNDTTNPFDYNSKKGEHSYSGFQLGAYNGAQLNMSMPELYPGSGSLRNPAAGNSPAPNIRSAIFTLPAWRLSQIKVNTNANERIVPYVARFNNWANTALDTDRNGANKFKFIPGQPIPAAFGLPALSAAQTKDQMLSRRDFAAQVAHYRMRGADGYVLFESGVVDYLNDQKRSDAQKGFYLPAIQSIFNASDHKLVLGKDSDYDDFKNDKDANGNIIIDGKDKTIEEAGAMFSGVYSLSLKKMEILLSNMDDEDHDLTLPSKIANFAMKTRTFDVDAGTHLLVEYKLTNSGPAQGWSVSLMNVPFLDLSNNRNSQGVPEPGSITFATAGAMYAMFGRRRRKHA